jgi:putative DNA primase/helicase
MTEDNSNIIDITKYLNPKSPSDETHSALEKLAESGSDPLTQDQFLRAVAEQTGAGLRSVRKSYEIVRQKLNLVPIDIGLSICQELLDTTYAGGAELSLSQDGTFFGYAETHWEAVSPQRIRGELQDVALKFKGLTNKSLHSIVSEAFGTLKDRLGQYGCAFSVQDEIKPVINFQNGELWLGSDGSVELKPHAPESQLLYCLPYEYDEAAKCPTFRQTMLEIFGKADDPEEMFRHICEFIGYIIQPSRPIPCFWMMIGHGANGKSKLMETISRLISKDYLFNTDLSSFGRDKFNISQLLGKLAIIDDDIKVGTVLPDGLIKKISETKFLSGRNPYGKQSFTFRNTALPVLVGNHYPRCDDLSDGMSRRAMIVPFNRQFAPTEQDNGKFEKIWAEEMPGVLNLAIQGLQRLLAREQFDPPAECEQARKEFLAHSNPLYCFLIERLEKDVESRTGFPELRATYAVWAKAQNITSLVGLDKTLKRQLQGLGYDIGIYNGYPTIRGYRLKPS